MPETSTGAVARTATTVATAVFLALQWAQLEQPGTPATVMALLIVCAVIPAAIAESGRLVPALIALGSGAVVAVAVASGYLPWELAHRAYPIRTAHLITDGARGWFDTTTPIDVGRYAAASADVRLVFFVLVAAFAWLVAAQRPLAAIGIAFAVFAVPATALDPGAGMLPAAILLVLCLSLLAACRVGVLSRRGSAVLQMVALGICAVAAGLVIGQAPGVAKGAFLDWRTWNPLAGAAPRVSVGFVWDQRYGALHWPKQRTVVMRVKSARPMYWKAAVLDEFSDDRWRARPVVQQYFSSGTDAIGVPDSLTEILAPAASHSHHLVNVQFTVASLADPHLLSAGQAIRYDLSNRSTAQLNTDGTVILGADPPSGASYSVAAYAPDPSPAQLSRVSADFPQAVLDTIVIGNRLIPPWGSGRSVRMQLDSSYVTASDQVWQRSGAASARSLYGAVVNVEAYLRASPFTYDQTPSYRSDRPVLVDFLTRSHHGYCQMFSGAMALVLRLHGIPARVAVGFTSGTPEAPKSDLYTVTDRNAHAWVEAYFPGYGWLPFDPTPTRNLPQRASSASPDLTSFAIDARSLHLPGAVRSLVGNALPGGRLPQGNRIGGRPHRGRAAAPAAVAVIGQGGAGQGSFLRWLLGGVAAVLACLALLKLTVVRWRYLRRGPRARASAAFHELATFVGDQGVSVGSNLTFEDLAGRLRDAFGVDATGFAASASAARYAPPDEAAVASRMLRRQLRQVKRGIRRQLTLRDRAFGAVRLRTALAQTTEVF